MRKIMFFAVISLLSTLLFAGNEVHVFSSGSNPYPSGKAVKGDKVKVMLKGDRYFMVDRFLGQDNGYYLFLKDGRKVIIPSSLVKEVNLQIAVARAEKPQKSLVEKAKNENVKEKSGKKPLILTDYNVERNYILENNANEGTKEKKGEMESAHGLSIKVLNQTITRKNGVITFKADLKNATSFTVGKLSIILNVYDVKGKLVDKKKVFLGNSVESGKVIPFTYTLKDPEGKITRFDYSFEGVLYRKPAKEE